MQAQYGPQLTPAAISAMPYTAAVSKEALRMAQIVPYVPRVATTALQAPGGGPVIPPGCPFLVALAAMSAADPAVAADGEAQHLKPDRWLQPEHAKSLALHQMPFGVGQHYCVGAQLANAELAAVLSELVRNYDFTVEVNTDWAEFPIRRPRNGLPCSLVPLQH